MRTGLALALSLLLAACTGREVPSGTLQLQALAGRWVVINYWATWCEPCIREIPELNALAERYANVAVLGVNFDGETGAELQRQVAQLGITFAMLTEDPAPQLGVARPVVLPTTLVLGPDGTLRDTLVGPQTLESLAAATGQQSPGPGEP